MRLKVLITSLLIGLLVGCRETKQNTTVQSIPEQRQISKFEVTEPTVPPNQALASDTTGDPIQSQKSVGEAAKLTPAQVEELLSVEKLKSYERLRSKKEVKAKFVVPTYIPHGFQVDILRTRYNQNLGGRYQIIYRNSSNSCFGIEGGIPEPIGDEPTSYDTTGEVWSPALGKIVLGYTSFRKRSNLSFIGFKGPKDSVIKNNNDYIFSSPVLSVYSQQGGWERIPECGTITFQEAVKIVESLQYLNPQFTSRVSTYNP